MASTILFNVQNDGPCGLCVGYRYDHKAAIVQFEGFDQQREGSTIYFKLQTDKNNWLIPLADMAWLVTQPMTLEAGEFRGQLVEILETDELIQNSRTFKVEVKRSVKMGEEYEVHDPELDLWATKLQALYDEIEGKLERGEFKGDPGYTPQKGVDYWTPEDIEEFDDHIDERIEEVRQGLIENIDDLDQRKMEYYMVTVEGYNVVHNGQILTFEDLIEKYRDPSVFLYMEEANLTLVPDEVLAEDSADDVLGFSTTYVVHGDVTTYQVTVDRSGTVHYESGRHELLNHKVQSINPRNKSSETNYPSNKAMTGYVDESFAEAQAEIEALRTENTELKQKVDEDEKRIKNLEYASEGKLYVTEEVDGESYSVDVPSNALPEKNILNGFGGKGVVWNQQMKIATWTTYGEATNNFDGTYKINGSPSSTSYIRFDFKLGVIDHIYYTKIEADGNGKGNINVYNDSRGVSADFDKKVSKCTGNANMYLWIRGGITYDDVTAKPLTFDLTQMFGITETSQATAEMLAFCEDYAERHSEYNEGEVIFADVESIDSYNNVWLGKSEYSGSATGTSIDTPIEPDRTYRLEFVASSDFAYEGNMYLFSIRFRGLGKTNIWNYEVKKGMNVFYIPSDAIPGQYDAIRFNADAFNAGKISKIKVIDESKKVEKPVSATINKYFPNGMKSAGSVHDYFDLDRGKAVTCTFEENLGEIRWQKYVNYDHTFFGGLRFIALSYEGLTDSKYNIAGRYSLGDGVLIVNKGYTQVIITDNDFDANTDIELLKKSLEGRKIIYEIEPIETDMDAEDIRYLRELQTEAGGSLIFKQNGTMLPIWNKETFLVKVGA